MRLRPIIVQRGVGGRAGPPQDCAVGEGAGIRGVPLLADERGGQRKSEQGKSTASHARETTRWLLAAASAATLSACGGDGSGPTIGIARANLLALARVDSAEPSPATFVFKNNQVRTFQIVHSDSVGTLFATFMFTPGSILSRNDTLLADSSTIFFSVSLAPGGYELTVGPASLVFNPAQEPVASVTHGRYGDASVYTMSPLYASAAEFSQALGLWHERAPDRWVLGRNSTHTGPSTVTSALEGPGLLLLAAPK
jgi:hypothetical protein